MAPGGHLGALPSGALPSVYAEACQRLQGVGAHHHTILAFSGTRGGRVSFFRARAL
jgi:hypothetical protein